MRNWAAKDLSALATTAQTDVDSTGMDMSGYDGAIFLVLPGAIDATGTVTATLEQSSDDGSSDAYAALTGATLAWTAADDNKLGALQISKPRLRYVRCSVARGVANSVLNPIIGILYKGRGPQPLAATVVAEQGHTVVVSPAES